MEKEKKKDGNEKDIKGKMSEIGKKVKEIANKVKDVVLKNKKIVIIVIVALALILCGVLFFKKSNEKELTSNMEKLGVSFYENYYYDSQKKTQKDVKKFLAKFEKSGIKINLTNLAKISSMDQKLIEGMVNSKTGKKCDFDKSYVSIYPTKPFEKKDYKLSVDLECGFEKK